MHYYSRMIISDHHYYFLSNYFDLLDSSRVASNDLIYKFHYLEREIKCLTSLLCEKSKHKCFIRRLFTTRIRMDGWMYLLDNINVFPKSFTRWSRKFTILGCWRSIFFQSVCNFPNCIILFLSWGCGLNCWANKQVSDILVSAVVTARTF